MSKIAAVQMNSSHIVDDNLEAAATLLQRAKETGSELAVLPENFANMPMQDKDRLVYGETFGDGPIQSFIAQTARDLQLWIVAGTLPIKSNEDNNRVRAASLVFNHKGELVARYDKIHLFDVTITNTEKYQESATIEPGEAIKIIETPIGKLGLSVCYDIRFPELFRSLLQIGAEIIAIPAAFTMKTGTAHWKVLCRARAIENFCYVVGAAQTGTHSNGRKTYGHSLIVNPWGEVVACLASGVGVIAQEIDLANLYQIRKDIPIQAHQKLFATK